MRLRQLQAVRRGDRQYGRTDRGRHVRHQQDGLGAFGAPWEVFALENDNVVRKTMWSVRNRLYLQRLCSCSNPQVFTLKTEYLQVLFQQLSRQSCQAF
jgi:hypothetical protein